MTPETQAQAAIERADLVRYQPTPDHGPQDNKVYIVRDIKPSNSSLRPKNALLAWLVGMNGGVALENLVLVKKATADEHYSLWLNEMGLQGSVMLRHHYDEHERLKACLANADGHAEPTPAATIPKPFAHLTPEQRKAVLDNWDRFQALMSIHTNRFIVFDWETKKHAIHINRIVEAAAGQLLKELTWKAALEASNDNMETDNS
jgi:hypothetical protein